MGGYLVDQYPLMYKSIYIYKLCIYDYLMNDLHTQQVEHAKYLGIIIDKNLTWSENVKKVVNKAHSVRGFLQRNLTK